jgi:acetyl-CoA acetyltransferase
MKEKYGIDAMGQTVENVAEGKSRGKTRIKLAFRSQQKASAARIRGWLAKEIVRCRFRRTGRVRRRPVLERTNSSARYHGSPAQARLSHRREGLGHGGQLERLNDGACALVASDSGVERRADPKARVVARRGRTPRTMGWAGARRAEVLRMPSSGSSR